MADVNPSTQVQVTPNAGKKTVYFEATKESQNDTVTFSDFSKVLHATASVEPSSGNWVAESVERVEGTSNQIKLTDSTTGTVYGWAIVEE